MAPACQRGTSGGEGRFVWCGAACGHNSGLTTGRSDSVVLGPCEDVPCAEQTDLSTEVGWG
eukprot:6289054-Alexandrium_andersonii.AAC.1